MINYAASALYLEAHWFFCWRYTVVAEELVAVTRSRQACSRRCLNITNIFVTILIVLDGVLSMAYTGILTFQGTKISNSFQIWSSVVFTILCIVLDCCMLLFAIVRVRAILKNISGVSLNLFYMTMHISVLALLILPMVLNLIGYLGVGKIIEHWFALQILAMSSDFIVFCFMAWIIFKVN